jgi:hypothetical protein
LTLKEDVTKIIENLVIKKQNLNIFSIKEKQATFSIMTILYALEDNSITCTKKELNSVLNEMVKSDDLKSIDNNEVLFCTTDLFLKKIKK